MTLGSYDPVVHDEYYEAKKAQFGWTPDENRRLTERPGMTMGEIEEFMEARGIV
ncbi:hypothetical protein SHEEN_52 [Mycobacterium phage Sheen]|uniref:Uncharacterized protein n=1 Tax=Mycobacterium phage Sheen TaxID=1589274 RepID=A0A0B5A475_9CAUD|nr:hypothetical protein AVV31_gp42 [Mycobacterium phage Sheen]AJD82470.1 hypothetical protein SHEEN_52 [Mycobacterium phage Sheen]